MFIGQSKGGKGSGAGITQKEQQKALADFRAGEFNTLVATCIGEEGLDICQVGLVTLLIPSGRLTLLLSSSHANCHKMSAEDYKPRL